MNYENEKKEFLKKFGISVLKHIDDISTKYIDLPETADSAVMFLPSESIYHEINIKLPKIVDESRLKKVFSRGSKIISIDVEDKSDNKKIIN